MNEVSQPLLPLRISKAVGAAKLNATLEFYGLGHGAAARAHAKALGFQSRILADETDPSTGDRAVTVMLSPKATVHMQFWARKEAEHRPGPDLPSASEFHDAVAKTQPLSAGDSPVSAASESRPFCETG